MNKSPNSPLPAAQLRMQLAQKLRDEAKRRQVSVDYVRKQYVFALFYRRIFGTAGDEWILLGGNALLARTGGGRFTQDIDLARAERWSEIGELKDELQALVAQPTGDPFRFQIGTPQEHDRTDPYGYGGRTVEVKVVVTLGGIEFETFKIDITQRRHVNEPIERIQVPPIIDHPTLKGLPRVPIVPIENQLADKICALYETHANGPSTRYRDLADIVRIVQDLPIQAARLATMLEHESRRRGMALPTQMVSPGDEWAKAYPIQAQEFAEFPIQFHPLDASLQAAAPCLDEVLAGNRREGEWDPSAQAWR